MILRRFVMIAPFLMASAMPGNASSDSPEAGATWQRTWTVSLQGGFASTFQMTLGGVFGEGPGLQNRLAVSLNNAWKEGDSLTLFGWSTTDLPSAIPNWQAGITYKNRVFRRRQHVLSLGGGMQRWLLPAVKTGAMDWVASGSLNYSTAIKGLPIFVSGDSASLVRSTLPAGSTVYTQIFTQHKLLKRERFQLSLRHGPQYTYSWGFYGAEGNRVVRYTGLLALTWKTTTIEGGYRQQFGLQDRIPYTHYWSFLVTRQLTRPFRSR